MDKSFPTIEQRLAARQPPARQPLMHNRWEKLLFMHWEWEAAALQARLPRGLSVDTYESRAYIGIVPFLMREVYFYPRWGNRGAQAFHELNVRTYVYDEQGRPGVWFFSLECDEPAAVLGARLLYALNYRHKNMLARYDEEGYLNYDCCPRQPRDFASENAAFRYRAQGEAKEAQAGSLEFFLVERYRLFSLLRGRIFSGQVQHRPYKQGAAELKAWSDLPLQWNDFASPGRPPDHVLFAQPVDVEIYALEAS